MHNTFSVISRVIIAIISGLALLFMTISSIIPGSIHQPSLAQHPPTAANTTTSRTTNANFQTYSNAAFGIKMNYPSNWLKLDLSRSNSSVPVVAFKSTGKSAGVLFLSGNVNYRNVTLATIVTTRENQVTHSGNILHLVSSTPATFAGKPAHKIVYTTIAPQGKFEAMQLISLVGKKGYFITYVVPQANYTTYLPTIQTIIDSAEITK
ncbi:MAG: PsbP-related protein [Candidatus Nitrosopolaris sp.]